MEATVREPGSRTASPVHLVLAVVRRSVWMSLLTFTPALVMATLWVFLRSAETTAQVTANAAIQYDLSYKLLFNSVLGPFFETVLFHLLVIELLLRVGLEKARHILPIAAILFIAVHFTNPSGAISGISVIPGGIVLAWCYLYWRRRTGSWRVAFMATWLTHGLHNFYFWLLNFVPASLVFG